jgi:hypothetical protein
MGQEQLSPREIGDLRESLQEVYERWQVEAAQAAQRRAIIAWVLVAVVGLVLAGSVLSGRWLFFGRSLATDHARMVAIAVIVAGVGALLYSAFPLAWLLYRAEGPPLGVVVGGMLIVAGIFAYRHVSKQHPPH